MKPTNLMFRQVFRIVSTLWFAAVAFAVWAAPDPARLDETHASVRAVAALQGQVTESLMRAPEIIGTAVGMDDTGAPALIVFIDREAPAAADVFRAVPGQIQDTPVRVELTEKFRAFKTHRGGGGGGTSHTALQTPPIQLGTSGGWRYDLANGYCCGGTLGSLVQVNGIQYIMSNYHVLESDIVFGGNNMVATTGSYVIQPGLIDVRCNASSAQNVATLYKVSSLPNSNVDVGIAQVLPGMVNANGSILEVGPISAQTVSAALNQAVKKSGRTTGLTHSFISGLNATISVTYENECAGGTAFTKTFTGQIVIANSGSAFLYSGDSGSLLLEDVSTYPRSVGLLFAGSSTSAIANPIGQVLQFLSGKLGGTATMVGF